MLAEVKSPHESTCLRANEGSVLCERAMFSVIKLGRNTGTTLYLTSLQHSIPVKLSFTGAYGLREEHSVHTADFVGVVVLIHCAEMSVVPQLTSGDDPGIDSHYGVLW